LILKITHAFFLLSILFFSTCKNDNPTNEDIQPGTSTKAPGFTLLSPKQTNINFANTLDEGLNTNVLLYEYFYNGGGVATGDFNGDDLPDIYFTTNMGENKLYLNKGNLQFEDITKAAGTTGRPGPWKTGVAIVDINGDNRLDIYLCYSGAMPEPKRANQLFINQGNNPDNIPVFKEEAAKYGLDSKGFSNQSYFFDFDKDGDLDMLLLNHNPKSLPVLNEVSTAQMLAKDDPFRGIRLFQQDKGFFKDITTKSGISGSSLSYGLGIGIADLNQDGWPDFYVSNDYTIPDYLYINNKNGTFSNQLKESVRYNSHFSMGNDIADLNNDGLQDIITLDMLPEDNQRQKSLMIPDNYSKFDLNVRSGFYYQYMRNMLQLNNGNGSFSEIGQLAGISNTDWSWAALAADYDNDGWKDLYITNGYHRDYTNLDFINYMNDFIAKKGRLQREDVLEIINNMPASDVVNYMFANQNLSFANKTKEWGMDHISNSNGAAYADLDKDGDLDLVVNNINQPAFVFQNESQKNTDNHFLQIKLQGEGLNTLGIGAQVTLFYNNEIQKSEQYTSRGYLSSVSPVLHFGLGKKKTVDSLIVAWPNGKQEKLININANQKIILQEKNATTLAQNTPKYKTVFTEIPTTINYQNNKQSTRDFDRQPLLISELSHQGPCMTKGDLNGDGLEDVFIGGGKGQSAVIYLQQKNKQFSLLKNTPFDVDLNSEDTDAAIFDANGDGHPDLYVTSGGYHNFTSSDPSLQDRLYLNDGRGDFTKSIDALPNIYESNATLAVHDFNADGHPDIFVGARVVPGRYPEIPSSALLINDGRGHFTNQIETLAPALRQYGMITDAQWVDINGDDQKDLIIVGEWLPVSIFISTKGKLENKTSDYFDKNYRGWWNTITVADFNKDQKPDLLLGNAGTNIQFQVAEKEPAELFYKDFDKNGSVDPLFCFYIQGSSYPYLTRDELVKQLPFLRSRFKTYQSYADAGIKDVFEKGELDDAGQLAINHLETSLFLSTSSEKFQLQALPVQAQYAPVNAIHVFDYNQDGNEDVLLAGNNSHTKLRLGSMEASYGVLLQGNGQGAFEYRSQALSGLNIKGDVKTILQMDDLLFFGINQAPLVVYKIN
jgi:hypothetical protein